MYLTLKTPPVLRAVSDDEITSGLKLEASAVSEEADVVGKVEAAIEDVQNITGRQLITATWQLMLERFPDVSTIELPKPPLLTVVSITYLDEAGVTQTLAASKYAVLAPAGPRCVPGWISLNADQSWPSTYYYSDKAVTIEYTAGYGATPSTVPGFLRSMILLRLGELYEHREVGVVGTLYAKTIDLTAALAGWRVL
jgi:uncharacterized phiE125 gp8 family phage protein